ncbi:hypothetical protein ACFLQR_00895 [Verrucomicrobiota bacterium]
MRKAMRFVMVLLVLIALGTVISANSVRADDVQIGQGLAARMWYGNCKDDDDSYGHDSLYFLYYDLSLDCWLITAMVGYAKGWDLDMGRTDFQLGLGRAIGPFVLGLASHYVGENYDRAGYAVSFDYYGPELVLGGSLPFGDTGFSASASVTVLPYVFLRYGAREEDVADGRNYSGSGHTWGWSGDAALHYAVKMFHLSTGYRWQEFDATDFDDGSKFLGDIVRGPYAEVRLTW